MSDVIGPNVLRYIKQHFDTLEAIVEAVRALKPADQTWTTSVSLGVGDGSGSLFIHGSYEAVTRVRTVMNEVERLRAENAELGKVRNELVAELDRHTRELEAEKSLAAHQAAELKRFREREEKVEDAVRALNRAEATGSHTFEMFQRPLAAVRDFKVGAQPTSVP